MFWKGKGWRREYSAGWMGWEQVGVEEGLFCLLYMVVKLRKRHEEKEGSYLCTFCSVLFCSVVVWEQAVWMNAWNVLTRRNAMEHNRPAVAAYPPQLQILPSIVKLPPSNPLLLILLAGCKLLCSTLHFVQRYTWKEKPALWLGERVLDTLDDEIWAREQ